MGGWIRCLTAATIGAMVALVTPFVVAEMSGHRVTVTHVDRVNSLVNDNTDVRAVPIQKGDWGYLGEFSLEPGGTYERAASSDEEFVYVLTGNAVAKVGEQRYLVGRRMALYLPAQAEVKWTAGSERFVAVQFFAGPSSRGRYEDWRVDEDGPVWPRPRIFPRSPRREISMR